MAFHLPLAIATIIAGNLYQVFYLSIKWYNYTTHAEINARSSQAKVANSMLKMLFKTVAWLLC